MGPAAVPDLAVVRQNKGLTLSKIADDTKIRLHYLNAIEQGQFDKLPGGVYNRNYIRQYARAISYNEADLLAYYLAMTGAESAIMQPCAVLQPACHFPISADGLAITSRK